MISYGYYFHDLVDPGLSSSTKPSLRNLLILIGDYFLVKSSYDVASFQQIELYKIYVQSVQKYSEGEALGISEQEQASCSAIKVCDSKVAEYIVPKEYHLQYSQDLSSKSLLTFSGILY